MCLLYERRDVLFLGDVTTANPTSMPSFTLSSLFWPLVKQKLPEAKFYVLGSNVTDEILALTTDDVIVVGYVEDLSDYMDRCRMSVVPLRYSAGMKGKIGTSMSYGVPCVATPIGVEGLGLKQGENILVGDTPENLPNKSLHFTPINVSGTISQSAACPSWKLTGPSKLEKGN